MPLVFSMIACGALRDSLVVETACLACLSWGPGGGSSLFGFCFHFRGFSGGRGGNLLSEAIGGVRAAEAKPENSWALECSGACPKESKGRRVKSRRPFRVLCMVMVHWYITKA